MAKKTKAEPDAFAKTLLAIHTREAEALERIAELLAKRQRRYENKPKQGQPGGMEPNQGKMEPDGTK